MIDIHTHLIPNVDDGAESMTETIKLVQAAIDEGIKHIVLTPHHNRYWVTNPKKKVLKLTKEVELEINKHHLPLSVSPSQEIRMNEEFLDDLFANNYLPLDKNGKYYLVEFSWGDFPNFAKSYLQEMIDAGITPIIAHPERQKAFINKPNLLKDLIKMGCLSQITATSIIGGYSKEIYQTAHQMIKDNLIHVIASDAHNTVERPFNFQSALNQIEKSYGKNYKKYLTSNAELIINSQEITKFDEDNFIFNQ